MRPDPGEDDEKSAYFSRAGDSCGTVPLTNMNELSGPCRGLPLTKMASHRFLLVSVAMGSSDWRREEACRGRAQELSFFWSGPSLQLSGPLPCLGHAATLSSWQRFLRVVQQPGSQRGEG